MQEPKPVGPQPSRTHPYGQLGHVLAGARKRRGYSQHDLAGMLGVSRATIQRVETGQYPPQGDLLTSWMRKCGVSIVVERAPDAG